MFKEINPFSIDLKPNVLHVYSENFNNSESKVSTFTLCLVITTPFKVEIFENYSLIYSTTVVPKTLFNELLCTSFSLKIIHHESINFILKNLDNEIFFKFSSNKKVDANKLNIEIINSVTPCKIFLFKNKTNKNNLGFIENIYIKITLKIRYTYIKIRSLILFTAKTLNSIIKYIFNSKI